MDFVMIVETNLTANGKRASSIIGKAIKFNQNILYLILTEKN